MMLHRRRGSAANSLRRPLVRWRWLVSMTRTAVIRLAIVQPRRVVSRVRWSCLSVFAFPQPMWAGDWRLRLFHAAIAGFDRPMVLVVAGASAPGRGRRRIVWLRKFPRPRQRQERR